MVQFDDEKIEEKSKLLREKEEENLAKILSGKYGVGYADLSQTSIDTDALKLISEKKAREAKIAAFYRLDRKIRVGVFSPNNNLSNEIIQNLEKASYEVEVFMISNKSLERAWARYRDISFSTETRAGVLEVSNEQIKESVANIKDLDGVIKIIKETLAMKKSYRISRIVETILAGALALKASDVHIEPEESSVRLRFRLNGILTNVLEFDKETYNLLLSRIKLLAGLKLNIKKKSQDGRFSIDLGQSDIEIRASALPGAYGESIVLRILNPETIRVPLEKLGMDSDLLAVVEKEISKPSGMILNTGPTGSGKTTTLYALLQKIHRPEIKIITIEDPVEYHLPGIVQTQVDLKKDYTFFSGLKASLRQDPDIIMVGEIRDEETARTAINASLTGHLVLSTLHTNSAAGTFPRLIDLGVNPKTIGPSLSLAMAQRLVRKLDEKYKKKIPLEGPDKEVVEKILAGVSDKSKIPQTNFVWTTNIPEGSAETGYEGRIGIFEAVIVDNEIGELINSDPGESELEAAAKKQGLLSMKEDGIIKVLNGVTSLEEVKRVIEL